MVSHFPEWLDGAIQEAIRLSEHRLDILGYDDVALGKDIDGSNFAFVTLAAPPFPGAPIMFTGLMFTGQFDGMWHTISNVLPSDVADGTCQYPYTGA